MTPVLSQHSSELMHLCNSIPSGLGYSSISSLNEIFNKYLKILDYVNNYNDSYRSATRIYYTDISNIWDNIQDLLNTESIWEKERAFENAKRELKTDLQSLALLIKPQEQYAD
jgi:hypothetical protein